MPLAFFFCEQFNGPLSVHREAQELFASSMGVLGAGRNLKLLNRASNIWKGLTCRHPERVQAGQTKLKAVSTGRVSAIRLPSSCRWGEQSLVHIIIMSVWLWAWFRAPCMTSICSHFQALDLAGWQVLEGLLEGPIRAEGVGRGRRIAFMLKMMPVAVKPKGHTAAAEVVSWGRCALIG